MAALPGEDEGRQGYFNLGPEQRAKWFPRFKRAGVSKVFCGHYHRNAGGFTADKSLEIVVTSAVGRQLSEAEVATNSPDFTRTSDISSGFRIASVTKDAITHEYYSFEEFDGSVMCRPCVEH